MRSTCFFNDIEDVAALMEYLYVGNKIVVENVIGLLLEISMDGEGYTMQKNLNFPESPRHAEAYQIPVWLGIIDQLKNQPKSELSGVNTGEGIKSRWDEIRAITLVNRSLRNNQKYWKGAAGK